MEPDEYERRKLDSQFKATGRDKLAKDKATGFEHILPFTKGYERSYALEWLKRHDNADKLRGSGPAGIRDYVILKVWESVAENPHALINTKLLEEEVELPYEDLLNAINYWTNEHVLTYKGGSMYRLTNTGMHVLEAGNGRFYATPSTASDLASKPDSMKVFIGHGHSNDYHQVITRLSQRFNAECVPFESVKLIGNEVISTLRKLLDECGLAVIVASAEDGTASGAKRARQNVVHEAGLWQGRHGFENVAVLVERPVESLSNLSGLLVSEYDPGKIDQTFLELDDFMLEAGFKVQVSGKRRPARK